ncbi:PLAC8 family protein [Prunus dulcis]|uniref:PLAC8 family protein n=1 Tax=Prunus dulcis TaxID=3755 RepID=A0A4Y1RQ99_PRUDU|nr:PLAC8 family protein [Prunus dulcis]
MREMPAVLISWGVTRVKNDPPANSWLPRDGTRGEKLKRQCRGRLELPNGIDWRCDVAEGGLLVATNDSETERDLVFSPSISLDPILGVSDFSLRSIMAINDRESNVHEESNPLLSQQFEEPQKDVEKPAKASPETQSPEKSQAEMGHVNGGGNGCGWTADGLPLGHGSVMGEPMGRAQWDSGLLACLGRNDDFCSSDLEAFLEVWLLVCCMEAMLRDLDLLLGRLQITVCLTMGSCEALHRSCGCCGSFVEDEVQQEQCETACDFATHVFCHACALCQEGREIRRRMLHPGFNAQPVLVMIPPGEQAMGRGA